MSVGVIMHKITPEQMKEVLSVLASPIEQQKAVFDALDLNPYDFYDDEEITDFLFNIVIYREFLEESINEVQQYPSEFEGFSEERIREIESGASLTEAEISEIKTSVLQQAINDDFPYIWIIAKMTDGTSTTFALYFEQVQGQGGLGIVEFFGFFATYEEAHMALKGLDLVDV